MSIDQGDESFRLQVAHTQSSDTCNAQSSSKSDSQSELTTVHRFQWSNNYTFLPHINGNKVG